jgi:hypothetical protein
MFGKTIWGGILAALSFALSPAGLAILPPKVTGVATGVGIILTTVGVRHAIAKNGTGQ